MELVVFSMLAFGLMLVLGMVAGVLCLVGWLIALPFRLFGLAMHLVAAFLALPLIALFGVLGFLIFGFGTLLFMIPLVPFALIVALVWWLLRPRRPQPA